MKRMATGVMAMVFLGGCGSSANIGAGETGVEAKAPEVATHAVTPPGSQKPMPVTPRVKPRAKTPEEPTEEEKRAAAVEEQLTRDAGEIQRLQGTQVGSKTSVEEEAAEVTPPVKTPVKPPVKPMRREVAFHDRAAGDKMEASGPAPAATAPQKPVAAPEKTQEVMQPALAKDPAGPMVSEADRMREDIVRLSRELYKRAADADSPLPDLMTIAALSLADPDRPFDAEALPGVSDREKEMLKAFQQFCAELSRELRASGDPETVVAQTQKLKDALNAQPPLALARAELCTRVGGFGDYDRFEKNVFLAASGQRAIVYVEIEEFTSEQNPKGEWVTDLSVELVMYSDRDGIPVWKQSWQSAPDVSKNRRRDFFLTQVIGLSDHLSVGAYTLKVRVRDEKSGAVAEKGVPFQMVADPGMAVVFPKK